MFPIHRLLLIVFLSIFAAPAFAQGNPTVDPTCRLPKQGVIVASVTYTLIANCEQTGTLEIKTANTPNITLTINGEGFTVSNEAGGAHGSRMNFLVVNEQGIDTIFNKDTTTSSGVRVVINDVTFDGKGHRFLRPCNDRGGTSCIRDGTGHGIYVEGTLEMEDVTFTGGHGIWVRAMGTTTLTNVLFEDSWEENFGFRATVKGVLHVAKTGRVTLNNAVFRDVARVVVAIEKGGRLSTTGCLSFIRVWTHRVHHSGVYNGLGTLSDSSTGPCGDSMTIGNDDTVSEPYTLPLLDCNLPSSGTIEGTIVYTLSQDCVCMNTVNIAAGSNVTINGNGHRIQGCSTGSPQFRIGNAHLTINNARIYGVRVRNYGGYFTLRNSMVATAKKPIINYGRAYLFNSVFEGNQATSSGKGKAYYAHGWFNLGRALFQDNMFRSNTPVDDDVEAYTTGSSTAIYLCGDNILDGLPEDANGLQLPLFVAANGGRILGCPQPDQPQPVSATLNCVTEYTDLPENKLLGAIGVIFYKQKCPAVIEIWEVLPDSQGQFALTVSQNDIDSVIVDANRGGASLPVPLTGAPPCASGCPSRFGSKSSIAKSIKR